MINPTSGGKNTKNKIELSQRDEQGGNLDKSFKEPGSAMNSTIEVA